MKEEPIYIKLGFNSDMEYFKFSYAGKKGEVKKFILPKLGEKHPFYAIKRPLNDKNTQYEFKIYDLYHNGVIEKEVLVDDGEEPIPTLTNWFNDTRKHNAHFREYLHFCIEACQY